MGGAAHVPRFLRPVNVQPAARQAFGRLDAIVGLEIRTNMSTTGTLAFGGDGVAGEAWSSPAAERTKKGSGAHWVAEDSDSEIVRACTQHVGPSA